MSQHSRKHHKGDRTETVQSPYLESICLGEECVLIQLMTPGSKPIKAFIFQHDKHWLLVGDMNAPTFRRIICKEHIATITPMRMIRDHDAKVQKIPNISFRARLLKVEEEKITRN